MPSSLHSPQYDIFRSMLIKAREEAGITQCALARRLGKPQSFVSKLERGERRLDVPEFVLFAQALGIDTEKFLNDFRRALQAGGRPFPESA